MAKDKEAISGDKLRLRIRSYDNRLIDSSCRQIIETLRRHDAKISGTYHPLNSKGILLIALPLSTRKSRNSLK